MAAPACDQPHSGGALRWLTSRVFTRQAWVLAVLLVVVVVVMWCVTHSSRPKVQYPILAPRQCARCVNYTTSISAFNDSRFPSHILVIVVLHKSLLHRPVSCHLSSSGENVAVVRARKPRPVVKWKMNLVGHFVLCPLANLRAGSRPPTSAAVAFAGDSPGPSVPIETVPPRPPSSPSLAACVPPLHGRRYDEAHVAAWVEMNRLLGVAHFTFYNHSMPRGLHLLLRHYEARGVVTLRQWRLEPLPIDTSGAYPPRRDRLHYYGQLEAVTDCLYRNTNRFRFIMFTDLDELIVPFSHRRLDRLLVSVDAARVGAFIFWMSYLRGDFEPEPSTRHQPLVRNHSLVFLRRTTVEERVIFSQKQKLVVKGHLVKRLSVHEVDEFLGGARYQRVSVSKARLFHYTEPPPSLRKNVKGRRNARVQTFFPQLIQATEAVLRAVRQGGT